MEKKATGITLIVIVYFIMGGLSFLWSSLVFGWGGFSSVFGSLFGAGEVRAYGESIAWSGFIGLINAFLQIVVAFGLLGRKKWAWFLALIGIALTVVQGVIGIFGGGVFAFMCGGIGLIVPIIILFYLLRPDVRSIFGIGTGGAEENQTG